MSLFMLELNFTQNLEVLKFKIDRDFSTNIKYQIRHK